MAISSAAIARSRVSCHSSVTECIRFHHGDLLACFSTQRETLNLFPIVRECFRTAPEYDFSRPPEPSALYDQRNWGMSSDRFCQLVREAEQNLQLKGGRP